MRTLLKALFGLLLVVLIVWRLDLRDLGLAIERYRWPWLLGALALTAASWPVAAWRWKLFARRFPFGRLLGLTLIGLFYSVVLPGQLAGELVKAWRLAKGQTDAERLAATVLIDRVIGLVSLLVVALAGVVASARHLPAGLLPLFVVLIVVCVCGIFALNVAAFRNFARRIAGWLESTRLRRLGHSLQRAIDAWREFGRSPALLAVNLVLGVAFQLLAVALFALLADNLAIHLPVADWAWIFGVVSLAVLIPVSVGGIGLREGALVGCLGFFGIPPEDALALSVGIFAVTLSGAAVGGVLELVEATGRRRRVAESDGAGPRHV